MNQEQIDRINALYRKSKAEGLTEEEKKEQALLRKQYVADVKKNLAAQLNNIDMVNPDGSVENLGDKYGKKTGLFAAGVLFGTAGLKVLSSDDAKKFYTNCTAAVLRAKKCVMKTVTTVQENCGDIYADAKVINEEREAAQAEFEDQAEDMTEVTEETPAEATEEGEA